MDASECSNTSSMIITYKFIVNNDDASYYTIVVKEIRVCVCVRARLL
jgi:hypothetical protein